MPLTFDMKLKIPMKISDVIEVLPELAAHHARTSKVYEFIDHVSMSAVASAGFDSVNPAPVSLGRFGEVVFPYEKMGAVDSLDLFGTDELIIFAFYSVNRSRYRNVADIGANLGLHSILMSRCGWNVEAYEPDPDHITLLRRNLELNEANSVEVFEAAVSDSYGESEFVRVVGNTTSSHLVGAKRGAYGDLERFPVRVESIAEIMPKADFIKMDVEGQERKIILGTEKQHWDHTDMMVEIGSKENADAIFEYLEKIEVNAFAQKLGWGSVKSLKDMPASYKEGSLFLSRQTVMPWTI